MVQYIIVEYIIYMIWELPFLVDASSLLHSNESM